MAITRRQKASLLSKRKYDIKIREVCLSIIMRYFSVKINPVFGGAGVIFS
jgi:hypothetical protein